MRKLVVETQNGVEKYEFSAPCALESLLRANNLFLAMPCGGAHTCGKCKVRAYGALSPLSIEERALLSVEEQLSNTRLACCVEVLGDCRVILPCAKESVRTITSGIQTDFYNGPSPFGEEGWAFAADIGTTTIAAYLLRLDGSSVPIPLGERNAQAPFGADIIARIAKSGELGVRALQDALWRQLDRMFSRLSAENNVPSGGIKGVVLTGNTAMLHFAAGLDPQGIAQAPFVPQSLFGVMYAARDFSRFLRGGVQAYLAPCVSAYVGGDTVTAMLACRLAPGDMLLDIGTNGEMALALDGRTLCCSAAAGPAFEGACLRYGMPAASGAINAVHLADGQIAVATIGGGQPLGICGAGAVSALASLLDMGFLDETGLLSDPYAENGFPLGNGVYLTQEDIRQLQLAKAAVAAALDTLLAYAGMAAEQVGRVYLAGGFGEELDAKAAARIGLFPACLLGRIVPAGNAAGEGACLCAQSQAAIDACEQIAKQAETIELSLDAAFTQRYMEQMQFPAK